MKNGIRRTFLSILAGVTGVAPAFAAEQPTPAAAPAQLQQQFILQRIVLLPSVAEAGKPLPPSNDFVSTTFTIAGINLAELTKRLIAAKDRPIDNTVVMAVAQTVTTYLRQHELPIAEVIIPDQNIREGILRLVLIPGTPPPLGSVRSVRTKGNHWFAESLLQSRLGVQPGDPIRLRELDRAVAWANNANPFRSLKLHLEPVPNTGEYDVVVGVEDRLPLRLFAAYDNTGNEILGEDRYTAAVTYGNIWGREHQGTYQFTSGSDPKLFKAHGVTYQMPLPWRHGLLFSANYVTIETTPPQFEGFITQKGESIGADAKYSIPFQKSRWQGEISGSLGFRQSNNNWEFVGTPFFGGVTDTFLAVVNAAGMREDRRGKWIAALTLTGSPGQLNSRSSRAAYEENRPGTDPLFGHAQLFLQRATLLTPSLGSYLRAFAQVATNNLLPSEQFSLGGLGSVRGYKERVIAGDHGYSFSHELQQRLPSLTLTKRLPKLDTHAVFFWDYGRTMIHNLNPGEQKSQHLASVGVGFRANVGSYFSAAVDYGRQLEKIEIPGEDHQRVHVKVTLSY